jgi:hypothetical protein
MAKAEPTGGRTAARHDADAARRRWRGAWAPDRTLVLTVRSVRNCL